MYKMSALLEMNDVIATYEFAFGYFMFVFFPCIAI